MQTPEILIIGGGLGGLATAAYLARAGERVVVLERSDELGGRARTTHVDGFSLNLGPHALYLGGAAKRTLDELGVTVAGARPSPQGARFLRRGRLHPLPAKAWSLLSSRLLGVRDKLTIARFVHRLSTPGGMDPEPLVGTSVSQWLRSMQLGPAAEELLHALIRVSTYANAPDLLDAGSTIRQLVVAQQGGVLYLDGGWQSMIDRLRELAVAHGAEIRTSARVETVRRTASGLEVVMAGGVVRPARAVVVAAAPDVASTLLAQVSQAARNWPAQCVPMRAACLDLALTRLPRTDADFALGLDQPLYFSVHSAAAALAPAGGAMIHVAKYLESRPDQASAKVDDAHDVRRELEAFADLMQPGWREHVAHARFLPKMVVAHALPLAAQQGTAGRPGIAVADAPGVYLVGDWVGDEGMLADVTLASARQVARRIAEIRAAGLALAA